MGLDLTHFNVTAWRHHMPFDLKCTASAVQIRLTCHVLSCRCHSSVFGETAANRLGADVEADSREGANEHAQHITGRPGQGNLQPPRTQNTDTVQISESPVVLKLPWSMAKRRKHQSH